MPVTRLAHPLAFAALLNRIGAPVESEWRRHRLPEYCDRPDAFVPVHRAWSFFDAVARRESRGLGWEVGRFAGEHNLNSGLAKKLESSPTLYEALKKLATLIGAESSHISMGICEGREDVVFWVRYDNAREIPGYFITQHYQLEVILSVIRHFVGPRWMPGQIGVEAPEVPVHVKERFPGTRFMTGQNVGYLTVPRSCLHLSAHDGGSVSPSAERRPEQPLVLADTFDFVDTLRHVLEAYLSEGYPTAERAASLVDTSARTLRRRLEDHGLTYSALVDELRFDVAKRLLSDRSVSITDITYSIGFSDPSHFARAFRRIGGLSPRQYRKAVLHPLQP